ncbi:MAG: tetratricopeptide repeat protein [Bacteroidia bacterium]|nr:tetratricopeptide repeat protein [Bacteroidia bacterium]
MSNKRKKELLSWLEQNPKDPFVLYAIGMECLSEKNADEAKHYFLKVLEIEPSHTDALFRLGQLYMDLGMEQEALEWFEKAKQTATQNNKIKSAKEIQTYIEMLKS